MSPSPVLPLTALRLTGGCQCGQVRYEISGPPGAIYVCHCRECRRQSASAFGISVTVRSADLRLTQGAPLVWSRPADSGRTVDCHFCPHCGSRLWHGDLAREDEVSVKGGSLDQPVDLSQAVHIWVSRKLPGVAIPTGVQVFDEEPC
ncbi:MAG TPA: GFA family protein [Dongiaceae bacterium]|nr:GFA family protein [Dongiaceae bacterium]